MAPSRTTPGPNRRDFLLALGGGVLAWPRALAALEERLPAGLAASSDEWRLVRDEFLIPPDRIYLNNGTLGPQPRVVVQAVMEHTHAVAMTFPPRLNWDDVNGRLASLLGGDADGFVVARNTTEAMNVVANGLDIGPGDEVVITDQEHIGGKSAWELVTTRRGATLTAAKMPVPAPDRPVTGKDLCDAIWAEVGPATRVLAVSHVLFTNGGIVPVEELARRCRERGVIFVVDAAHPPGLMDVDLDRIRPDFWVSSPHKWLCAPQGTGLLWIAPQWREPLWPTLASGDWATPGSQRFRHVGTMDESRVAGLVASLEFHRSAGGERIFDRVRELQAYLRAGLRTIPGVVLRSPDSESTAGMLSFEIEGVKSLELQGHLAREARIRSRVIGEYELGWMRLSTHLYTLESDLDTTLELLDGVARNGLPARD